MEDNTYQITYDYDENNVGIPEDNGTWENQDDGTILLTSKSGEELLAVTKDNGDGTITYTLEVTNAATSVTCNPTGMVNNAEDENEPSIDGLYVLLTDKAQGWLGCNVYLMEDNTYQITYDYDENNVGIPEDNGIWEKQEDDTILLTSVSGEELLAVTTDNGTGTITYTLEVTNAATSIVCNPIGTVTAE